MAIVLVLVSHFAGTTSTTRHLGATGVAVFFVLSGFLITSLLLEDTPGRLLARFYGRRVRRLLPALAAMVAVVGAVQVALFGNPGVLVPVVFYVGNWFAATGQDMGLMKHTWSLSVEEQFYLVWPLVMLTVRRDLVKVGRVAAYGALASGVWSGVLWATGASWDRIYFATDTRAVGLLAGCWLAARFHQSGNHGRIRPVWSGLVVVGLVGVSLVPGDAARVVVCPLVATVGALLLITWSSRPGGGWLTTPVLSYAGRRSYAWYLWSSPLMLLSSILLAALHLGGGHTPLLAVVGTLVTVGVGEVSWRYVEAPALRRRRPVRVPSGPVALRASLAVED